MQVELANHRMLEFDSASPNTRFNYKDMSTLTAVCDIMRQAPNRVSFYLPTYDTYYRAFLGSHYLRQGYIEDV